MKDKIIWVFLIIILVFAFVVRVYKVGENPVGISWDEAAVGYNGYTISTTGRDEWGNFLPLVFKSFGDDKHPVHIYITSIFVSMFGLNEIGIRLPVVLFGTLNILLVFLIGKNIFGPITGLWAAFFLALSQYHFQYSRFNHELNFALLFFMIGVLFFIYSLKKGSWLILISCISFGISFLSYHPSKVVLPLFLVFMTLLYFREIVKDKIKIVTLILFIVIMGVFIYFNPQILGFARIQQTAVGEEKIKNTEIYKTTNNVFLARLGIYRDNYLKHFEREYLFEKGDINARHSARDLGQFNRLEALLVILGCLYILVKRNRRAFLIVLWFFIAPLGASFTDEAPHASRAMFMLGSWQLLASIGVVFLYELISVKTFFRKIRLNFLLTFGVTIIIMIYSFSLFLGHWRYYFEEYPKKFANDWQYGMKQVVEYIKENPKYSDVYMTDLRSQPYIFYLFYMKVLPEDFLSSVELEKTESRGFNLVSFFEINNVRLSKDSSSSYRRYYFGGWDWVHSTPNEGVLYVLTPNQYSGLSDKGSFEIKKRVNYPNGEDAFYLVSIN